MYWARIRANRESLGALAHNMWIAQGSIDTVHVQIDDDLKAIELLAQTGCTTHNLDPKQVVLNSDTGEFVPKDSIAVPLTRPGSHPR
jgi:hypothetical protein